MNECATINVIARGINKQVFNERLQGAYYLTRSFQSLIENLFIERLQGAYYLTRSFQSLIENLLVDIILMSD